MGISKPMILQGDLCKHTKAQRESEKKNNLTTYFDMLIRLKLRLFEADENEGETWSTHKHKLKLH